MHPLDGPRLKVRRAESEIQALQLAEDAFRKEADYRVVRAEFNPKSGKYVYRMRVGSPPPDLEWGVTIGEIAHNLRSALDGLVWQLALLTTKAPARNTQFPVFLLGQTTRKDSKGNPIPHFENTRTRKRIKLGDRRVMIRQLKLQHQARIERLQPYKRGLGGKMNVLYLLQEINNADKHRLIQVVGARPGGGPVVGWWGDIPEPKFAYSRRYRLILEDGAKFGEAHPNVSVRSKVMPLVAFWKGCKTVEGEGVCHTLSRIAEHVSEIVEGFATEFSVIS